MGDNSAPLHGEHLVLSGDLVGVMSPDRSAEILLAPRSSGPGCFRSPHCTEVVNITNTFLLFGAYGDGSVSKVLTTQAGGPEFRSVDYR